MNSPDHTPRIVVLTAPSGSGKTTIANRIMAAIPAFRFSVSATTRPRRPDEKDGKDYHFISHQEFQARIHSGEMLEHEEVYPGRLYGTLRSELEGASTKNPILLDIDIDGAFKIKHIFGNDALIVFIRPPSVMELGRRLRERATENEDTIRVRLDRARRELDAARKADKVIENDSIERAVKETLRVVRRFIRG